MTGEFNSSIQTERGHVIYISEKTGLMKEREIEYAIVNGRAIFEGDIIINTQEGITAAREMGANRLRTGEVARDMPDAVRPGTVLRGVVIVGAGMRWPNALIPYTIDPGLPNQARITDAITHWEANTPVHFHVRTSEADYITFFPDPKGCASWVGRQGGQQGIWLASGCSTGNAIHEIGHTVGLWHEQSREDRNSFVTIHYENIEAGYEHNFDQHIADGDDVGGYDYGSIMHYPNWAFSKNGLDTITPPAGVSIGQREALSFGDIMAVAYMYGFGDYYVGNVNTHELHMPSCYWASLMAPHHKRSFWTVEEAKASGYNGCWYCNRYWDTG
jgi:astacin